MLLILVHVLAVLTADPALPHRSYAFDAAPASALRRVSALADDPFCIAIIEERDGISRNLHLGCYPGGGTVAVADVGEPPADGPCGYRIVVFPPPRLLLGTVIITTEIERKTP